MINNHKSIVCSWEGGNVLLSSGHRVSVGNDDHCHGGLLGMDEENYVIHEGFNWLFNGRRNPLAMQISPIFH